jgi:protein-S-isoprenylcysteine O-methyltransferase Ste14
MAVSLFPIENFPNETFGTVFSVLFILIILVELRILLRNRDKKNDKSSLKFILLGIFVPLFAMIFLSFGMVGRLNVNWGYVGIVVMVFGFLLRQYSIFILGKYFNPVIMKQKGQEIITNGPYSLLRHPSYTGLYMELLGAALAFSNWISFLIVLVLFVPAISNRIEHEEEFMINNFKDYKDYMNGTWKLVPFVY